MFLEFTDVLQRIHSVPRKAADRFCDDKVNLAGKGILDHLVEAIALLGVRAAYPFVRQQTDKEFAIPGNLWRKYVSSPRIITPILKKDCLYEIVDQERIEALRPERRFDQTL